MPELDFTRSINLATLLVIITTFEGTFLGIYLLFKKSVKNQANRYLGGLLLIVVTVLLPGFFYRVGILPQFPHVIRLNLVTAFLFGPLALFYVQSCLHKNFNLTKWSLLHFLFPMIVLIYLLPLYLKSGDEKLILFANSFLYGDAGAPKWFSMLRMIHPLFYFIVSVRIVAKYRKQLPNITSFVDVSFHRWLLFFCVFLLFPIFVPILYALISFNIIFITITTGLSFFFVMAIRIAILTKPRLFHVFPHQMLIQDTTKQQKQKYEKSTLQTTKKERYVEQLIDFVQKEKPYLTSDLTLTQLSKQVKIPAHHLSQIINEKLNCNFLDFINQYRIKEAQAKLLDPSCKHYTIVSIAYDSGFNSKSTFYNAFKKQTMMTPNQYRKQQAQQMKQLVN